MPGNQLAWSMLGLGSAELVIDQMPCEAPPKQDCRKVLAFLDSLAREAGKLDGPHRPVSTGRETWPRRRRKPVSLE